MMLKFFVCIMCLVYSTDLFAAKSSVRSASSKTERKTSQKSSSKASSRSSSNTKNQRSSTANVRTTTKVSETNEDDDMVWDNATCDAEYMRCMNKVCSSDDMGKCICYEDNTTNNLTPSFLDIDGMKVKKGFEALDYAKNQCTYILDKCKDSRRSVTEKYKSLVQRDCLLITQEEALKSKGLAGDIEELKKCMKDPCTLKTAFGEEDFSAPEYSLCFSDNVAKFSMDAYCSSIISKSSSPLSLKQLFLDEMALRREESCIAMKGTLSNDRKSCYVTIKYGLNKNDIKKSKSVPVGSFVECSADAFDAKKNLTPAARRERANKILSSTATALNSAGAVLEVMGNADPIGKIISSGIDLTETGVDLGFDIAAYARGELDLSTFSDVLMGDILSVVSSAASFTGTFGNMTANAVLEAVSDGTDIAVQGVSVAKDTYNYIKSDKDSADTTTFFTNLALKGASIVSSSMDLNDSISNIKTAKTTQAIQDTITNDALKGAAPSNALQVSSVDSNTIVIKPSEAASKAQKTARGLEMASKATGVLSSVIDTSMTFAADNLQIEEENLAITKHAEVDRESGTGVINETKTEKGNCFLNNEWFATENEVIMLLWKN